MSRQTQQKHSQPAGCDRLVPGRLRRPQNPRQRDQADGCPVTRHRGLGLGAHLLLLEDLARRVLRDGDQRGRMLSTIAPVWDGNETWLVLGGGGLLAVFPLAYSIILPALYAPIILMLLSLVFRGVAFEFRWQTPRARGLWDRAFALGSIGAAVAQGLALGALVQGIPVSGRAYAGGWWDWLTPFSLLTALGLTIADTADGARWSR